MKFFNSHRQKVLSGFSFYHHDYSKVCSCFTYRMVAPTGIFANSASPMQHIQEADCLHEIISIILKLSQFHMFGRREPGTTVKKITLLKSYFPFNYCIKFINTFCCWWNDPPLTFQFIIAAPLMRPQEMEMRPINMLRVKVTNRNRVRALWVTFRCHWHSKQHGRMALLQKHLA